MKRTKRYRKDLAFELRQQEAMRNEQNGMRRVAISCAHNQKQLDEAVAITDHQIEVGTLRLLKDMFPDKIRSRRNIS